MNRASQLRRTLSRRTVCVVAVSIFAMSASALRAAEPLDLSHVSSDVVAAVVLHPHELLTAPEMEMLPIEVIVAAGKQHLGVDPLDIEQMIGTVGIAGLAGGEPAMGVICRFSNPYDPQAVLSRIGNFTEEVMYRGKKYRRGLQLNELCICTLNERTLLLGNEPAIKAMLSADKVDSPLVKLLRKADASKPIVAVVDVATLRPLVMLAMQNMPPVPAPFDQFLKVPELVSWVEASYDIQLGLGLSLTVGGNDAAAAAELKQLTERAKSLARQYIAAQMQPQMAQINDPTQEAMVHYSQRIVNGMIDKIAFEVDEDRLRLLPIQGAQALTSMYTTGMLVALLLPATQAAREAARRTQSVHNMKQIGLAMLVYEDSKERFPARALLDNEGKPLLSWRVAILPYLDEKALYDEFHLDEPWDSEHNRRLIARMPAVYGNPNLLNGEGKTGYLVVAGPGTAFGGKEGLALREFADGTSNTILMVEANQDRTVEWTRPSDLDFDPAKPMNGLGSLRPGGWNALFADGSVQFLPKSMGNTAVAALMSYAGGEVVRRDR